MAIARKITKEEQSKIPLADERQINALIEQGGSVTKKARAREAEDTELKSMLLKVPQSQVDAIDEELQYLPAFYRRNRTAYISQAIDEKIARDRKKRK